jgi:hypothetical protein
MKKTVAALLTGIYNGKPISLKRKVIASALIQLLLLIQLSTR